LAIFQRQYTKILSQELLRYLLLGRLPNVEEIGKRIGVALGIDGQITYQYVPQPSRSVFQHRTYNKGLKRIKFDIDTFHEELLDLFNEAVQRVNYADLFHKVNSHELAKLQSTLETILFSIENADFYFLGAFDNFSDTSKIDFSASTPDIINLAEQALALPYGGRSTQRIKASHMSGIVNWPIDIVEPDTSMVVSSKTLQGTAFGNAFVDTTNTWVYEVITTEQVPVEIKMRFPLAGAPGSEVEVFVSRIELIPHSSGAQQAIVKVSTDDVNYIAPLGFEEGLVLEDQKITYAMDFETNLVQYIELTLKKESPDDELVVGTRKQYQYLFGLRGFSALTTGRLSSARYQSLPFDFSDEEEKISKVSIQAVAQKPPGTNVSYSVALADDDGLTSSFVPITPVGKDGNIGVNQVINFNTTTPYQTRFTVTESGPDAAVSYGRPFQGKEFFRIGRPVDPAPIFGTGRLFRGFKSWYRDSSTAFQVVEVEDNYVSFEETDLEALYDVTREVPGHLNTPATANSARQVTLNTTKDVYYDVTRGHALKPEPGVQNSILNIKPNYAVYAVRQYATIRTQSLTFALGPERVQELPSANFILQSTDPSELPSLELTTGSALEPGRDYVIETEDIGGRRKPTGRVSFPETSQLLNPQGQVQSLLVTFTFTNDPDITHKVIRIEDNVVTLDNAIVNLEDTIEIVYRFIPKAPNEIIKASIRVSDLPTTSQSRTFYVEGNDYVIDPRTGAIQRIPTGNIPDQGSVYVKFSYRNAELGIETYLTWCHVTATDGVQLRFDLDSTTKKNKLVADGEVGEAFFVNTPQGLINLTNATSTPTLGPGWVQFVARSKNPDANIGYGDNLIDQVIQLRDDAKKKIFRENGPYFQEVIAFREPLKQRTLNHLRVNTLLFDHSVFAIDDITDPTQPYIVLNFLPNDTPELYNRAPGDDSEEDVRPSTVPEDFLFLWESRPTEGLIGNKVVIRIDLERDPDADGSLTSKVFEYRLRAGF
jgi:hypothetical protein